MFLSHQYRIKLEGICNRIASHEEVSLSDMVWAEKLSKTNQVAARILRQARRKASTPTMKEGDMDDILNQLDLGDPDPSNHITNENSIDDIVDFFKRNDDEEGNWRRRD